MTHYRETYATINLDHLLYNVNTIYDHVQKPMMAIIKANAYGHGYKEVATILKSHPHIQLFGVATLKEAVDLRELGVTQDILILGAIPLEDIHIAIDYNISVALFSKEYLEEIKEKHSGNQPLKVHLAIDSGMNRIGIKTKEDFEHILNTYQHQIIEIEGVFTHFATADDHSSSYEYNKQLELFKEILGDKQFKYIHCDNSAAMMYHHSDFGNLVRLGISMYGVDPAGEENKDLKQVMSLYTRVAMIKTVPKGEKIGYGMTYTTSSDELIATLPIGYADGFIRKNQGRHVYINGRYYPVVGRVCMDQCMIRVDEHVKLHDKVEIFGEHITLASMAKDLETIPYEIICLISLRVEREYEV